MKSALTHSHSQTPVAWLPQFKASPELGLQERPYGGPVAGLPPQFPPDPVAEPAGGGGGPEGPPIEAGGGVFIILLIVYQLAPEDNHPTTSV